MLNFKYVNIITILFLIVFLLLRISLDISFWWLFRIIMLWLILTSVGSFHIRWNYFMNALHNNSKVGRDVIAITFDDGPHPEFTPQAIELLKKYDAKATFFCIGKNAEKYPELVKNMLSEGHVIGNHSYSHINSYGFLSLKEVLSDIQQGQEVFKRITNLKLQFFRPPFGVTNPNISKAVKKLNLKTFGWRIRSFDTIAKDPDKVFRKISSKIQKGDIILLHDSSQLSMEILEKLLQLLQNNNLKSVTLERLFNLRAYV